MRPTLRPSIDDVAVSINLQVAAYLITLESDMATTFAFITLWFVLFAGTPDMSDAINSRINCEVVE